MSSTPCPVDPRRVARAKPIAFCADMVRATLAGTKTQTRRVIKEPRECTVWGRRPLWSAAFVDGAHPPAFDSQPYLHLPYTGCDMGEDKPVARVYSPWRVGGLLWVRETWCIADSDSEHVAVAYRADDVPGRMGEARWVDLAQSEHPADMVTDRWRPSIFMPRWASRITLRITDVRVQRVQEISEADAKAEGMDPPWTLGADPGASARDAYAILWDWLNSRRGKWDSNPWVWALTFEVLRQKQEGMT